MWAIIIILFTPIIPLYIHTKFCQKDTPSNSELFLRYSGYLLTTSISTLLIMYLFYEEGTSFLDKIDSSILFTLKFFLIVFLTASTIALSEWAYTHKKIQVLWNQDEWRNIPCLKTFSHFLQKYGLYLLALFVLLLNASLLFDNVFWGDEAFSAKTVQTGFDGILEIVSYLDSHPPFYYLWLRCFVVLFGDAGWVLHLASFIPFTLGILVAVTIFQKQFGKMPSAFFIIVSGLSAPCVEYNAEVRMYALCFFFILMAYYCSYSILATNKGFSWFTTVIFAVLSAYSHYYGLMIGGILIVSTTILVAIKHRKKAWLKGVLATILYIIAYIPWLRAFSSQTQSVSENWWNDTILPLNDALTMVGAGLSLKQIILPLMIIVTLVLIIIESKIIRFHQNEGTLVVSFHVPSIKEWSVNTYFCITGILTIILTLICAYLACYFISPILAMRYLYMLIAISILIIVVGISGIFHILQYHKTNSKLHHTVYLFSKIATLLFITFIFLVTIKDFNTFRNTTNTEKVATQQLFTLLGSLDEDVVLVNNGIKHIGWTVLSYYYPNNEVVNGTYLHTSADEFYYFSSDFMSQEDITIMQETGYTISGYGQMQLAKYPFVLYYFEK